MFSAVSFELSDKQNMSNCDAETKNFRSNHSSSSCEPETTTSPPSKIKPSDQSRQPVEKHTDYEFFCCHPKVAKFNSLFSLKLWLPGYLPYPIGFRVPKRDVYQWMWAPLPGGWLSIPSLHGSVKCTLWMMAMVENVHSKNANCADWETKISQSNVLYTILLLLTNEGHSKRPQPGC